MSRRKQRGQLAKLDRKHKAHRAAKRARKGTWAVRVWANRHIKGDV